MRNLESNLSTIPSSGLMLYFEGVSGCYLFLETNQGPIANLANSPLSKPQMADSANRNFDAHRLQTPGGVKARGAVGLVLKNEETNLYQPPQFRMEATNKNPTEITIFSISLWVQWEKLIQI